MKQTSCSLLLFLLLLCGCSLEADPMLKEKQLLQGVWMVISSERMGENDHVRDLDELELIFEGNIIRAREQGKVEEKFSYTIDPTRRPKAINLTFIAGPYKNKNRTDEAIYEIEGNTLRICIQEDSGGPRPTKFASPKGSSLSLVELRRK